MRRAGSEARVYRTVGAREDSRVKPGYDALRGMDGASPTPLQFWSASRPEPSKGRGERLLLPRHSVSEILCCATSSCCGVGGPRSIVPQG
jgi:hypothetical protein